MIKVNFFQHTRTHKHSNSCIYARLMKQNVRLACIRLLYQRIYTSADNNTHLHEVQNECAHTEHGELFPFMQVFFFAVFSTLFSFSFSKVLLQLFCSCTGSSRNFITIHNSYFFLSAVKTSTHIKRFFN